MDTGLIKEAYHHMMAEHGNSFIGDTRALVHSDQGTQYLSTTFKQLLENDHLIQSVSARGNSQDNAPAESFFAKFKTEIMRQLELCTSYEMAVQMIDGYTASTSTTLEDLHHTNTTFTEKQASIRVTVTTDRRQRM